MELLFRSEVSRIAEIEEREVFVEIILCFREGESTHEKERKRREKTKTDLNRSTGEDNSSFTVDLHQ